MGRRKGVCTCMDSSHRNICHSECAVTKTIAELVSCSSSFALLFKLDKD